MIKRSSNAVGFTLLEVMISVAILGVIMTLIWSTTAQTFRAKETTENRDMIFHEGNVALRKITDDLTAAFLAKQTSTSAPTPLEPQAQTTQPFKTFFIGEDNGSQDSIKFTSLSHVRLFKNAKESDQCRVMYEVVESQEEDRALMLMRREDPWLSEDTNVQGKQLELVSKIKEFNVEYFDLRRNEWIKSWDTEKVDNKDRMPMAIKVTLVFADPADENIDISISSTVMPAMSSVIEM